MADWQALEDELNAWADAGQTATLWWRDDDASKPCDALARLLALSRGANTPLGLAVVPQWAVDELAPLLAEQRLVEVMQHGFAHKNHAGAGEKKCEFPPSRPRKDAMGDLMEGGKVMQGFANRAAVLVPPWNRFDTRLLPVLPGMGVRGISAYGPRARANAAPALRQVNTHVDPINWRGGRGFLGEGPVLAAMTAHLQARRQGEADADEPTGLLTHHLDHDEEGWCFIARLLDLTGRHSSVKWLGVNEAFGFR